MAARDSYLEFLVEQFGAVGEIATRPMFGGHTLYCSGVPFAIVAGGAVYLKVDDGNRAEFEARGLRAFRPFPDKPGVMQYYETPAEVFEDSDALRRWVGGAVAAGKRAQIKGRSRARRRVKSP